MNLRLSLLLLSNIALSIIFGQRVGIGLQNPQAALHIDGAVKIDSTNILKLGHGSSSYGVIGYNYLYPGLTIKGGSSTYDDDRTYIDALHAKFNGPLVAKPFITNVNTNPSPYNLIWGTLQAGDIAIKANEFLIDGNILQFEHSNSNAGLNDGTSTNAQWQSFNLNQDINLGQIELFFGTNASPGQRTIRLYGGTGTGGSILAQSTITVSSNSWCKSSINSQLNSNTNYTIWISSGANWMLDNNGLYTQGQSSYSAGRDYWFKLYKTSRIFTVREDRVGLGVTSPMAMLDVNGTLYTDEIFVNNIDIDTDENKVLIYHQNGFYHKQIHWQKNGNDYYLNKKVGIGTSSNLIDQLTVSGTIKANRFKLNSLAMNDVAIALDNSGLVQSSSPGILGPWQIGSGTYFTPSWITNYGFGTNNPQANLHVEASNTRFLFNQNGSFKIEDKTTNDSLSIFPDSIVSNQTFKFSTANGLIKFNNYPQQSNNIYSLNNGNLGIGIANPTHQLEVAGGIFTKQLTLDEGSIINQVNFGSVTIGSSTGNAKILVYNFPNAFTTTPVIIATARNTGTTTDQFVVTTSTVTNTSVTFIVRRVNTSTNGWGQNLTVDWYAMQ
jgi:hypothetical protein